MNSGISVEKKCSNCYHYKSMRCPSSDKCYSKSDKPYWVLGKGVVLDYTPTLFEKIIGFFKKKNRGVK